MLPITLTMIMLITIILTIIAIKRRNKKVALLIITSGVSIIASVLLTIFVHSLFVAILVIPAIYALVLIELLESTKKRYIIITLILIVITGCIEIGMCNFLTYQHEISVEYTITIVDGKTNIVIDKTPVDLKDYVSNVVKNCVDKLSIYSNVEYKGKIIAIYVCDYPRYKKHECSCNSTSICENCKRYTMLNKYSSVTLYENIVE